MYCQRHYIREGYNNDETALALVFGAATAQERSHVNLVKNYAIKTIKPWLTEPIVINTIKVQNVETANLKDIEIDRLDIGWKDRLGKAARH